MAKRICLQAGHENCQYNSIVNLRRSTGAPNEMTFNVDIRNKVAEELRRRGFEVATTDANGNDDSKITGVNWDLFLSIHYDADVYNMGGGFVDFPHPPKDLATAESQRIVGILETEYFNTTKIMNKPNRRNDNTKLYYMWRFLSAATPCAIIECGVGMHVPDDWQTLHFNRPLVVEGIVRGICKSFGVAYDAGVPNECDTIRKNNATLLAENKSILTENNRLNNVINQLIEASLNVEVKSKELTVSVAKLKALADKS